MTASLPRIQNITDLNPRLVPQVTSLTYRAQSPEGMIEATHIEFVGSDGKASHFEISFADESKARLSLKVFNATDGVWHVQMGQPHVHDVAPACALATHESTLTEEVCVLSHGETQVWLGLRTPFLCIRSTGREILASPGLDLNVGNALMSFPFFKHAQGFGMSFGMHHQECFFGGGEDFGSVIKNGRIYDIYNSDALGVNGQLRYQSTPYFWSSHKVGLALLNAAPSRVDFGHRRHEVLSWSGSGTSFALLIQPGGEAKTRIAQFRRLIQIPVGVPEWSLGLWLSRCFYKDQAEVERVLREAKEHGIEVGVVNLDARCWMRAETRTDFVWDLSRFEAFETFIPALRARGIQVCLWENPYVSSKTESLFSEGASKGFFAKTADGKTYPYEWVPEGLIGFPKPPVAGLVDFTNPSARAWWKDQHRPFIRAGVRCFKTDFGEEIPADAHFADGSTGWTLRNKYADLYNECVMEVLREETGTEGIVWARSGWLKTASCPVKWAGDSQTHWRALRATLRAGLSQAVAGALFWSHDIGGFYGPEPEPELFLRWSQMGLWCSHARCHGTTAREPWAFGPQVTHLFKQALAVRTLLLPYFQEECLASANNAQSLMLPLWLAFENDPFCLNIDDQFMVGRDVLVAPFLDEDGGRRLYLPTYGTSSPSTSSSTTSLISPSHSLTRESIWRDLRTGEELQGGQFITTLRTPHLPVFTRRNSAFDTLFAQAAQLQDK